MSKKTKVIESNVQPNPKEAEIWAKVNEDGSREIKQYNSSTGKFECCGGSGNGSGEASTIEYLDVSGSDYSAMISSMAYINKGIEKSTGKKTIGPAMMVNALTGDYTIIQCMIDFSALLQDDSSSDLLTIKDFMVSKGVATQEQLDAIPRITKEEFYNLEA